MTNYIGVRCPVCNKKFTQADDIVVCPVCGAPHHRECYAVKSACAFVSEHMSGKEWRAPAPETQGGTVPDVSICPVCNSNNPKDVIFCQVCGKRMSEAPPPGYANSPGSGAWGFPGLMQGLDPVSLMYGGLSPDEKIGGESVRDLAVYIGDNSAYYLMRFKNMDETSRSLTFNFSALIFSFLYYFHRKMYAIGAFLLLLFIVGAIPGFLQAREMMPQLLQNFGFNTDATVNQSLVSHYQSLVNIASTINFAISFVMSFCANHFYFTKVLNGVRSIRESQVEPHDEIAYNRILSLSGGISRIAVIVVICALIAAYFIVSTAIMYQCMGGL